jgi:hypothetical protein
MYLYNLSLIKAQTCANDLTKKKTPNKQTINKNWLKKKNKRKTNKQKLSLFGLFETHIWLNSSYSC